MEYIIGFSIGCIFTGIVMCRFSGEVSCGILKMLREEMEKVGREFKGDK